MKHIVLVLSVAALMAAIMVAMAAPAFAAGGTPGKGASDCAKEVAKDSKSLRGPVVPALCR